MCLIESKEIEIISEIYPRTSKRDEDDPMGQEGQGGGVGPAASPQNPVLECGSQC